MRYHTDDSIQIKYYDKPEKFLDKMAFSLTGDVGCEHGGGVSCFSNYRKGPKQSFIGFMFYNRFWFNNDHYGLTLGGGKINNPGRYLVLLPPINGATAISGTPYFTENPGDPYKAWDASATWDYMPNQYITFRCGVRLSRRQRSLFLWPGGITPPAGIRCPIPAHGHLRVNAPGSVVAVADLALVPGSSEERDPHRPGLLVKF